MRKSITTIIIALSLLFLFSTVMAGPNLAIPEPSFDFGYVPQHAKISHVFWLHSTGDSTLVITKVTPG
ncbi:MAG: hypothetical protein JSV52_05570 [Candidatus Zixiibacteriota bacterium]|nr:MAG: hypothetical protein JSV52_05570 [candidate division Zixibacteria bacterium]